MPITPEAATLLKHRRNLLIAGSCLVLLCTMVWLMAASSAHPLLAMIRSADIAQLKVYLLSFGYWAPAVSGLLMILQAFPLPLPTLVITITNGVLFGAFWGTLLSWSSAMVAAVISWSVGRSLGRPAVEGIFGAKIMAQADEFFARYGSKSVLLARLIPVLSFRAVSYVAGMSAIRFSSFMVSTGLGQLPATIVYSALGENLVGYGKLGLSALGVVATLIAVIWLVQRLLALRLKRSIAARTAPDSTEPPA